MKKKMRIVKKKDSMNSDKENFINEININNEIDIEFTKFMKSATENDKKKLLKVLKEFNFPSNLVTFNVDNVLSQMRKELKDICDYKTHKLNELKTICKTLKLKVTGSKWDLIHRIWISKIDFNKFDSRFVAPFIQWVTPVIESQLCKYSHDMSLLQFLELTNGLQFHMKLVFETDIEEFWYPFLGKWITPQMAILAWITYDHISEDEYALNQYTENDASDTSESVASETTDTSDTSDNVLDKDYYFSWTLHDSVSDIKKSIKNVLMFDYDVRIKVPVKRYCEKYKPVRIKAPVTVSKFVTAIYDYYHNNNLMEEMGGLIFYEGLVHENGNIYRMELGS